MAKRRAKPSGEWLDECEDMLRAASPGKSTQAALKRLAETRAAIALDDPHAAELAYRLGFAAAVAEFADLMTPTIRGLSGSNKGNARKKSKVSARHAEINSHYEKLKSSGMKPTRAAEKTAEAFGCSLPTVYKATKARPVL